MGLRLNPFMTQSAGQKPSYPITAVYLMTGGLWVVYRHSSMSHQYDCIRCISNLTTNHSAFVPVIGLICLFSCVTKQCCWHLLVLPPEICKGTRQILSFKLRISLAVPGWRNRCVSLTTWIQFSKVSQKSFCQCFLTIKCVCSLSVTCPSFFALLHFSESMC